jgi:hypothetical protein
MVFEGSHFTSPYVAGVSRRWSLIKQVMLKSSARADVRGSGCLSILSDSVHLAAGTGLRTESAGQRFRDPQLSEGLLCKTSRVTC